MVRTVGTLQKHEFKKTRLYFGTGQESFVSRTFVLSIRLHDSVRY